MDLDRLYDMLIRESRGRGDWMHHDEEGTHALKADVNVWLKERRDLQKESNEEWHKGLGDGKAVVRPVTLHYGCAPIETFRLAFLDGGKVVLPVPRADDMTVDPEGYAVAAALDVERALDENLDRLKIRID